jgi:hypothetical protein
MADDPPRGPEVPPHEDLFRCIFLAQWWDPTDDYVSAAIFGFPKFSAFIASMTTEAAVLARFPAGSGMLMFNAGTARALGFDSRHEPEQGEESHANVYRTKQKKQTRQLLQADTTRVTVRPDVERLCAATGLQQEPIDPHGD